MVSVEANVAVGMVSYLLTLVISNDLFDKKNVQRAVVSVRFSCRDELCVKFCITDMNHDHHFA
jgi:hypothetical protein